MSDSDSPLFILLLTLHTFIGYLLPTYAFFATIYSYDREDSPECLTAMAISVTTAWFIDIVYFKLVVPQDPMTVYFPIMQVSLVYMFIACEFYVTRVSCFADGC